MFFISRQDYPIYPPEEIINLVLARRCFKKACDGGNMNACNNLGSLESIKGNKIRARSILNEACDKGNNRSCWTLVRMSQQYSRHHPSPQFDY